MKRAERALKAQKSVERFASSLAEAINITNEMFQYEERVTVHEAVLDEIKRLEAEVILAKERYNAKRKEFYAKRKMRGESDA